MMSAFWVLENWGSEYPPENAQEIIDKANELIAEYAEVHDKELTLEFSERLWDIYCTTGNEDFKVIIPVTRTWRVYGANGHRQRESFHESKRYDFSFGSDVRILDIRNADITGTNEYTEISITRNTAAECEAELEGQLWDGLFEDSRIGKVVEITEERETPRH